MKKSEAPADYQTVLLSRGRVAYRLLPAAGELVVLLHGLSIGSVIFAPLAMLLNRKGYRVLLVDLYGRGLSERVSGKHTPDLFRDQLQELLEHLKESERFHIIASSMGGIATAEFANAHEQRVASVCMIAPAGFPMPLPAIARITRLPLIGDLLMALQGARAMKRNFPANFTRIEKARELWPLHEPVTRIPGTLSGILSSLRHMRLTNNERAYARYNSLGIPTLILWGTRDRVVPYSVMPAAQSVLTRADFVTLDGEDHLLHFEIPERVVAEWLKWRKKAK